jgi:hypothetical protein
VKTITLPGIGPVKGEYVIIGVGVPAVWILWRYRTATKAASSAATAGGPTPSGYYDDAGNWVDTSGASGGYYDASGNWIDSTAGYNNSTSGTVPGSVDLSTGAITTNAQWTQAAVKDLSNIGYDAIAVTEALGRYLGGQSVTSSQANMVRAAIAYEGPPPVGTYGIQVSDATTTAPPPPPPPPPPRGTASGAHAAPTRPATRPRSNPSCAAAAAAPVCGAGRGGRRRRGGRRGGRRRRGRCRW